MKNYLLVVCLLIFSPLVPAQSKIFEEGNISTNDVFAVALTPDEKEIFFVKAYGGRNKLHLMSSKKINGKWSAGKAVFPEDGYKYIDPFVTPDGKLLLFNTTRPKPGSAAANIFRIWAMKKTADGWSEPFYLGDTINSDTADFYATADRRNNLYFTSRRAGGFGDNDIWMAQYAGGKYRAPVNIGADINTAGNESNPFISPNGDYLLYFSITPDGFGDSDLYISFRKKGGSWTKPQNLGKEINTELGEFTPYVSPSDRTLYFTRLKKGETFIENIHYYENFDRLLKNLRQNAQ